MAEEPYEERWELTYRGRVQGVGFRHRARELARHFAVTGFVQNRPDGSVLLVAEGRPAEVGSLADEIASRMQYFIYTVDEHRKPATGQFDAFDIRF